MTALTEKKCKACESGARRLQPADIQAFLKQIPEWALNAEGTKISRTFPFKGYYKTMAFVNAVAWIAHEEGHHPDLQVSYNQCVVEFTTHAMDGLSENDFICAAKVDELLR